MESFHVGCSPPMQTRVENNFSYADFYYNKAFALKWNDVLVVLMFSYLLMNCESLSSQY